MTDHDLDTDVTTSIDPVTSTLVLPRREEDGDREDPLSELDDEDWPSQVPRRGIRLRIPTAILLALLLGAAGLWGGSVLQKDNGAESGTAGLAAPRAAFGHVGGAAATSTGSSTGVTSGTVTDIIGSTLYVTNSSGQLIKVTLSGSASVTRNASSTLGALKPGDTVTVEGTTPTDGAMTASSVAATAKGVATTGGLGAGGRFGGGPSTGGSATGAGS